MNTLQCIIVDDEPLAVKLLENYIRRTEFLECVGTAEHPKAAQKLLERYKVNLVFLDIQMPGLNGIDFASSIHPETRIIFTTAFSEYALTSYKLNALDYLLKPFNYDEFLQAVQKAWSWFQLVRVNHKLEQDNTLFIKSGYQNVQLKFEDIFYFQGFKDYIKIYLKSEPNPLLTLMTMKSMISHLPSDKFLRVHRSYIVPISRITKAGKASLMLDNEAEIPISESYKNAVMQVINNKRIR